MFGNLGFPKLGVPGSAIAPIGLPLGLLLCFPLGFGIAGLWTGLAPGLTDVALLLLIAWRKIAKAPRARPVSGIWN